MAIQSPVGATGLRWLGLIAGLALTSWLLGTDVTGAAFLLASPVPGLTLLAARLAAGCGAAPVAGWALLAVVAAAAVAAADALVRLLWPGRPA
jgi:hypothetical protein